MPDVVLSPQTEISDAPGAPGGTGEAGLPEATVPLPPEHAASNMAKPKNRPRMRLERGRIEFKLLPAHCMNSFEFIFPFVPSSREVVFYRANPVASVRARTHSAWITFMRAVTALPVPVLSAQCVCLRTDVKSPFVYRLPVHETEGWHEKAGVVVVVKNIFGSYG